MTKYLVVVESPTKARTISKFLGSNYVIRPSYGHVRDLPKNELGVDIENDFTPKYVTLKESSTAVKAIRETAEKVEEILIATDPDREGEAIGWHVAELLKNTRKPVHRIEFHEITKNKVVEATRNPREINTNLVNAQQARRILDRLVGYKLSPILHWSVRKGLSAGRVQSVAVRMVCEREAEIRSFVPKEYWTLDAHFLTEHKDKLKARLFKRQGELIELPDELTVKGIIDDLQDANFLVSSVEKKEVRRRPYPPFITSSLQQEASRRLGFSPRKTMIIAQQLYEGVDVGEEGLTGLITYMRTDSPRLAQEAIADVRAFIQASYPPEMLPEKPNFYRSSKEAQDAHEAIRPTLTSRTPDKLAPYLTKDQLNLYTLIWKRFVACQMTPAIFDQTIVTITAKNYEFRATGSVMKFPGFTVLYEETSEDKTDSSNGEALLPEVHDKERLTLTEFLPEQHFTKPPPRYTEASLIRALEENGIGRPSTYAPTLNTIIERGYVIREKGRLAPTELGEKVNALLVKNFPDVLDIAFTARLEADLDHVEEGQQEWHALLREFFSGFQKDLEQAQKVIARELVGDDLRCPKCGGDMELREGRWGPYFACLKYPLCNGTISLKRKATAEPTDQKCDRCGAPMVIRNGRFGRFLACSNYPKCKNTHKVDDEGNKVEESATKKAIKTDKPCPKCGAFLVIRQSRNGDLFYGCEKYPKCKYTQPMELDLKCPREGCGGDLIEKRAKRTRFIGCSNYPECKFTTSGKPDKETPCPACDNSWTIIQSSKNKPPLRKCPVPTCQFEEEIILEPTE